MRDIPELLTPRLRLRGHREKDHAAAIDIWTRPEVYEFITGSPLGAQDVWLRLLRYSGLWDFLGYGYWALEERATGRYVGQMGFADFRRELEGFDTSHPEAGWVLHPDVAGQGYATEGMQAACAWLDQHIAAVRSFCIITPQNTMSIRLAEKLGYHYELDTLMNEEATAVYYRDAGASQHE